MLETDIGQGGGTIGCNPLAFIIAVNDHESRDPQAV